jgi:hypothetical protein
MPLTFFSLPRELRDMVYSYSLRCIHEDRHVAVVLGPKPSGRFNVPVHSLWPVDINLALLRTCRDIHNEAAAMLYSQNTFCVLFSCMLEWLVAQIGPTNSAAIRVIILRAQNPSAMDLVRAFHGTYGEANNTPLEPNLDGGEEEKTIQDPSARIARVFQHDLPGLRRLGIIDLERREDTSGSRMTRMESVYLRGAEVESFDQLEGFSWITRLP